MIDHHHIGGDVRTSAPIYFRAMPVGCTSTIIWLNYLESNAEIDTEYFLAMEEEFASYSGMNEQEIITGNYVNDLETMTYSIIPYGNGAEEVFLCRCSENLRTAEKLSLFRAYSEKVNCSYGESYSGLA